MAQINANMLNHICIKEQLSTMKFNEVTGEWKIKNTWHMLD